MIAAFTLGALLFGLALVARYFYSDYSRRRAAEGFDNVPSILFVPQITPGGADERSSLSPNGVSDNSKLLAVPSMTTREALKNWGKMTSERCYRSDIGESLKLTRNYLQRTNNYQRSHPDSCSAPNHELIGTFYTPFDGVGRTPASGANYPASTLPCAHEN